jgi:hypothetical protein
VFELWRDHHERARSARTGDVATRVTA